MFISPISFKELQIASWKVRETNREEASKETAQGTWGSIPSHLYQRHIRLWLKQGLTWVSNKQAKSRLRKSRQEPRGERMTVLLHQEKPIWNARLTIRRNKWERCSLGCSCPQSKSTGTLTLFTRKVVKSCLQPSPEGTVRVWKKKTLKNNKTALVDKYNSEDNLRYSQDSPCCWALQWIWMARVCKLHMIKKKKKKDNTIFQNHSVSSDPG